MKTTFKSIFTVCMLLILCSAYSQGKTTKTAPKKAAPAIGKSVAVQLKNLCEKDVIVFVGQRADLKNPKPKQKVYGGLSTNTVYASINEVVCILNEQEKPVSCINVKPGVAKMEVNSSGTVITAK